nr:hypothetical protein [Herbidospora daliensis]
MTIHGVPSSSRNQSWTGTTAEWVTDAAARASRSARWRWVSTASLWPDRVMRLSATLRPSLVSRATHTVPMPPAPS